MYGWGKELIFFGNIELFKDEDDVVVEVVVDLLEEVVFVEVVFFGLKDECFVIWSLLKLLLNLRFSGNFGGF